ncbi:MAG: hypothetical protein ACXVB1_16665, partial [Pseudobdellovibrionaceae bacterium]
SDKDSFLGKRKRRRKLTVRSLRRIVIEGLHVNNFGAVGDFVGVLIVSYPNRRYRFRTRTGSKLDVSSYYGWLSQRLCNVPSFLLWYGLRRRRLSM